MFKFIKKIIAKHKRKKKQEEELAILQGYLR